MDDNLKLKFYVYLKKSCVYATFVSAYNYFEI